MEAAYEIFSIERRFQWSKSRFSRFKETCAHDGVKERYPRKSCYFTVVGQSFVKQLQIGIGMLSITTNTSDELFSRITSMTLKDLELPK